MPAGLHAAGAGAGWPSGLSCARFGNGHAKGEEEARRLGALIAQQRVERPQHQGVALHGQRLPRQKLLRNASQLIHDYGFATAGVKLTPSVDA